MRRAPSTTTFTFTLFHIPPDHLLPHLTTDSSNQPHYSPIHPLRHFDSQLSHPTLITSFFNPVHPSSLHDPRLHQFPQHIYPFTVYFLSVALPSFLPIRPPFLPSIPSNQLLLPLTQPLLPPTHPFYSSLMPYGQYSHKEALSLSLTYTGT